MGLFLQISGTRNYLSGALLCPLLTFGLFRLLLWLFEKTYHRTPASTFLNFDPNLSADRLFNVVYFILGSLIVVFLPSLMAVRRF